MILTFKQFISEESHDDYVARLMRSLKIKRVGKGYYSSVFQHPKYPNIVVKVFDFDMAYDEYLKWCLKNQQNKYVPKIIGVERVRDRDANDGEHVIVFFEKLDPCTLRDYKKFFKYVASFLEDDTFGLVDDFFEFNSSTWKEITRSPDKDLAAFAKFMASATRNYGSDLHDGNIMYRGKQIVIIDPITE